MTKFNKFLLVTLMATSSSALAVPRHTASIGYSYSYMKHNSDNPSGVNVKYRFNAQETRFGVIGSATYNWHSEEHKVRKFTVAKEDLDYISIAGGPTFRVTNWFSVYGLVGIGMLNYKLDTIYGEWTNKKNALVYGGGMQFNISRIAVDLSYERGQFKSDFFGRQPTDTVTLGLGYRF